MLLRAGWFRVKKRDEDSVVGLTRNNIGVLCDIDYMSEPKLFIPALLGTPRKNRESGDVAKWVCGKMREREEIETQLFDVCDFDLPHDHYGQEIKDRFPERSEERRVGKECRTRWSG